MQKKLLAFILTVALVFTTFTASAFAASKFTDLEGNPYVAEIERWTEAGVFRGMTDTEFDPNGALTRAQIAAILTRVNGYVAVAENTFTDVSEDDWFCEDILKANAAQIFLGNGDGTMTPNVQLNRETAVTVMARVFGVAPSKTVAYEGQSISPWALESVNGMKAAGLLEGLFADGFNASKVITRAEAVKLLDNCVANYITTGKTSVASATLKDGNVLINVPGVTLTDLAIKGNLIIAEGVGEGEVTLKNVTVSGTTEIRGGGTNSVILSGNTKLNVVNVFKVGNGVSLKATESAFIETLNILAGSDEVNVSGKVTTVNAAEKVSVSAVNATIANLILNGKGAEVSVDGKSAVTKLTVAKNAEEATVEVLSGGSVKEAVSNAVGLVISGSGRVEIFTVNADNNKIETTGTKVTVATGVKGTVSGTTELKAGTTTTTKGDLPVADNNNNNNNTTGSNTTTDSTTPRITFNKLEVSTTEVKLFEGKYYLPTGASEVKITYKVTGISAPKTPVVTYKVGTGADETNLTAPAATFGGGNAVVALDFSALAAEDYSMTVKIGTAKNVINFTVEDADKNAARNVLAGITTSTMTGISITDVQGESELNAAILAKATEIATAAGCTATIQELGDLPEDLTTPGSKSVTAKFTVTKNGQSVSNSSSITINFLVEAEAPSIPTAAYTYDLTDDDGQDLEIAYTLGKGSLAATAVDSIADADETDLTVDTHYAVDTSTNKIKIKSTYLADLDASNSPYTFTVTFDDDDETQCEVTITITDSSETR